MPHALIYACLAMLISIAAGHVVVPELLRRKLGKAADTAAPEAYRAKAGTPVMGGVIFLIPIAILGLALVLFQESRLLLPLAAMLISAALASFDDFQTLEGTEKLSGHETWFWALKWGVLFAIAVVVAAVLYFDFDYSHILVPHFGAYDIGILYLPVVLIVFVGGTSGMVITDGMDGLMAGVSAIAYGAYGVIALTQGQDELGAFCLTVMGAAAGFLWFNANPAQVFMGEVGSQSLAVGLVIVAFMTGWWLLLPVIGFIFFAEGFSDAVQIAYFKATHGKRFFRMAPIHYHFQLGGWTETQVVTRFWLVGLLAGMGGVALARLN